jgi:hypothetical protein
LHHSLLVKISLLNGQDALGGLDNERKDYGENGDMKRNSKNTVGLQVTVPVFHRECQRYLLISIIPNRSQLLSRMFDTKQRRGWEGLAILGRREEAEVAFGSRAKRKG